MMLWWITAALAGQVYLNDQPVPDTALAGVDLSSAAVRIDGEGDVYVAPPWLQWRQGRVQPAEATAPEATTERGWWMLVEDLDSANLEVEADLNARTVASLRSGEGTVCVSVAAHVVPGDNQVELRIRHRDGQGRIAVTLSQGTLSDGLLRLEGEPRRWTLGPGSEGHPIRFGFTGPDALR